MKNENMETAQKAKSNHRLVKAMNLLDLSVKADKEPTTGYWFAYVGYDDGDYTSANTSCGASHKTVEQALNALTKIVIRLIDQGELKSN